MGITGLRAGGSRPINAGGVIQPCRQASNHNASDSNGLRVGRGGADFRNYSVSIGDQDGLATGGEPNILTELIFEQLETNGSHVRQCSLQRLLCQNPYNGCQRDCQHLVRTVGHLRNVVGVI
jgi:hypothetical protein